MDWLKKLCRSAALVGTGAGCQLAMMLVSSSPVGGDVHLYPVLSRGFGRIAQIRVSPASGTRITVGGRNGAGIFVFLSWGQGLVGRGRGISNRFESLTQPCSGSRRGSPVGYGNCPRDSWWSSGKPAAIEAFPEYTSTPRKDERNSRSLAGPRNACKANGLRGDRRPQLQRLERVRAKQFVGPVEYETFRPG